jgi:CO dehydrogenase/acetyl-CoA synthase gamma subunit (corrinoid Fe-S protein)
MPKVNLSDLEKLKIAYEVIRDLESRDDIKGLKNAVTSVKNLIANDIAFDVCFS